MNPACVGTVAFLDEENATPFTRIWCVLEDYVTIQYGVTKQTRQLFDCCTIIPAGECEGFDGSRNDRCAGILLDQGNGDTADGGCDLEDPAAAWFPGAVSVKAFRLDVRSAHATVESDRTNILRLIGDRADEVNTCMRRMFWSSAAYMAVTDVASEEGTKNMLVELLDTDLLTKDEMLSKLEEEGCVADAASYVLSRKGNTDCLRHLLEFKCDPNNVSSDDRSGLQNAFECGSWDNARLLLDFGADPQHKKPSGGQALEKKHIKHKKEKIPEDIQDALRAAGFTP